MSQFSLRRRAVTQLTPLLLLSSLAAPALADVVELHKGVLIDTNTAQTVLMRASGGIEAIGVSNGATQWESDQADRPLAIQDNRLVAQVDEGKQRGEITIAMLDASNGLPVTRQQVSVDVAVRSMIDDQLDRRFDLSAPDPDNANQLVWTYQRERAQGALLVDHGSPSPNDHAPAATPQVVKESTIRNGWLVADVANATVRAGSGAITAAPRQAVERDLLPQQSGRQFISADGRAVLVSNPQPTADLNARHRWSLFTTDGQALGSFAAPMSYAPFVVVGDIVLFVSNPTIRANGADVVEQPLQLNAVSVDGGRPIWSRELRDTRYFGDVPI